MTKLEKFIQKKFKVDAQYFLRGGFWFFVTQLITVSGGVSVSVLFAHILTENEYGTYRYILGICLLLSSLSLTGVGQSILQAAAKKYYQYYLDVIKTTLVYSTGIVIVSVLCALYYYINGNGILAFGCLLIAIFQPLIGTYQNIFPFLQGSKRFHEYTIAQLVKTVLVSTLSIGAVLITQNIIVLLITYFGVYTFSNFITHLYFKPQKNTSTPNKILKRYLNYAKHTSVRGIITNASFRLDSIIIFTQLGAAELAVYTIANIIPEQIKGSCKNLSTLLLPKYAGSNESENIKKNIPKRSFQLFTLLLIMTILYILIAPYIFQILFPKYTNAVLLSQMAVLSFPAMTSILPTSLLRAEMAEKYLYQLQVFTSITNSMMLIIGTLVFGIVGTVFARVAGRYIYWFSAYYLALKKS